jgi:hypothetical protein
LKDILDAYDVRARLYPTLLVVLPAALLTISIFPASLRGWSLLWGLFVWCGGTVLLAQIGRDPGKKKQTKLFNEWGGVPTIRILRYSNTSNKELLIHRHKKLQSLIPDLKIPGEDEEIANPKKADAIYHTCTKFLRERTRDKDKFRLVFEENCNYGFRRNLWAMKPFGVSLSLIAFLIISYKILKSGIGNMLAADPQVILCAIFCLLLFIFWLFCFTEKWVEIAADAYADRLLSSVDII